MTKKAYNLWGKNKIIARHTKQGQLLTKVTLPIDFTDEPVIWCDVPVAENTLENDCKWMMKMTANNNGYKLLQIDFHANTFIYCLGTLCIV